MFFSIYFYCHLLGYKIVKGSRLSVDELRAIFEGLMTNKMFEYDYILTGYMDSGELLKVVAEYVQIIKQISPHVKYRKYTKIFQLFSIMLIFQFAILSLAIMVNL